MSILSRKFGRMAPRPFDPTPYLTLNGLGVVATSVSRYDTLPLTTDVMGDKTQLIHRTFAALFAMPQQETRDLRLHALAQNGDIALSAAAKRLVDKATPDARKSYFQKQETRRTAIINTLKDEGLEYDSGKILADISAMELERQRHAKGPHTPDANSGLPVQKIYDKAGNVLAEGRAASVEHLIQIKMDEAAQSTDPAKRVLNLDGADLSRLHLKDMKLANVSMRDANIKGTTIENCTLQNVDMSGAEGDKKTKIKNTVLYNVDMSQMDAPGITLEGIRGAYINMAASNFAGAKITDMRVENLWAVETNLNGATIGSMSVTGPHSSMDDLKINNAKVSMSHFGTEQQGIPMRGMQAVGTTWSDVNFHKSMLDGANFAHGSFTRVNMDNVTTKTAPMNFYKADITGLRVGPQAELTANEAIKDGITLRPVENFVFKGTAPLDEAVDAAVLSGQTTAIITNNLGAIQEPSVQVQRAKLVQRPAPLAVPTLTMKQPWEKRT